MKYPRIKDFCLKTLFCDNKLFAIHCVFLIILLFFSSYRQDNSSKNFNVVCTNMVSNLIFGEDFQFATIKIVPGLPGDNLLHPLLGILCHYVFLIAGSVGDSRKKVSTKIEALNQIMAIYLPSGPEKPLFLVSGLKHFTLITKNSKLVVNICVFVLHIM